MDLHQTSHKQNKDSALLFSTVAIRLGGQEVELTVQALSQLITELFDNSPVGVSICKEDTGQFVTANKAFLEPLQYDIDELLKFSYADITAAEYHDIDIIASDVLLETGSFPPYKKVYKCKDNSRITVERYGGVLVQAANQNLVWSYIEDITQAENTQSKLENKLDLMDVASHQTSTGIWTHDLKTGELKGSDEIYRIFEFDKENFIATLDDFLAAIYPADSDHVHNAYQQSLIDKKPYHMTHRLLMKDGRVKFVRERATTRYDENGDPLFSIGTIQDITLANHSRVELQRSPILEASQDFIGISDLEGRITFINRAGRDMCGVYDDFDQKVWMVEDLYVESDQKAVIDGLMPAVNNEGCWRGDLTLNNSVGGKVVIIDCNAFRIDNPATGEPMCFATVSQDITKRKAAESELQAYKESLELRIAERTVALQEANLKAEQANKAKSVFLSRMSHELRTPLNAVLGFSQLIKHDLALDDIDQIESIDEVLMAGGHLLNLINDMLDISLIENGVLSVENVPVNISKKIQQSIASLSMAMKNKKITLITEDFGDVYVMGDATRIVQVIANVLSNAIKYNKQSGSVEVTLSQPSDKAILVVIKDSGIGIQEEHLARIFDPFERLNYTSCEGSGIGLSLVKELVELMGGEVKVDSLLGQGTTVSLQFIASDIAGTSGVCETNMLETDSLNAESEIKVLYIEDVAANTRLMRRILLKLGGLTFLQADNGKQGLALAKEDLPSLILLDINLPDMTGLEVLRQLKISECTKGIPVIAVSANAFPEDIDFALKQGFDDYITKPFQHDKLIASVNGLIDSGVEYQ